MMAWDAMTTNYIKKTILFVEKNLLVANVANIINGHWAHDGPALKNGLEIYSGCVITKAPWPR